MPGVPDTNTARRETIGRAIALMDEVPAEVLSGFLARTGITDRYQENPGWLREVFVDARDGGLLTGAYDAATQLLNAAGQLE